MRYMSVIAMLVGLVSFPIQSHASQGSETPAQTLTRVGITIFATTRQCAITEKASGLVVEYENREAGGGEIKLPFEATGSDITTIYTKYNEIEQKTFGENETSISDVDVCRLHSSLNPNYSLRILFVREKDKSTRIFALLEKQAQRRPATPAQPHSTTSAKHNIINHHVATNVKKSHT